MHPRAHTNTANASDFVEVVFVVRFTGILMSSVENFENILPKICGDFYQMINGRKVVNAQQTCILFY